MYVLTQESIAWLRAHDEAGVPLPEAVAAAKARLDKAVAELAELPATIEVKKPGTLVAEGVPLAKAQAESEKLERKAADLAELSAIGRQAVEIAHLAFNRAVAADRDALVAALAPHVDAVIEKAVPLARQLQRFAPDFAPARLLKDGMPEDMIAYQESRALEATFGHLVSAWRWSLKEATGGARRVDLREVPEVHLYWTNPELVASDALAGRKLGRRGIPVSIQPDALNVALENESCGFRLVALEELQVIFDRLNPTLASQGLNRRFGARAL